MRGIRQFVVAHPGAYQDAIKVKEQHDYGTAAATPDVFLEASGGGGIQAHLLGMQVYDSAMMHTHKKAINMAFAPLRYVQQFLVDPEDSIPLEKRVLYKGEIFLTDETDGELVYRVPVQELLAKHNEYRATVRNKRFQDKEVFLDPAKIRDLRLTTVTIAQI